jgi:ribosomal protein S12 methylthiotransferase accessory factor
MDMTITFPGGKRVDAQVGGHVIRTDQSPSAGGAGSAPEPFTHFLASIGTCAGIYVLGFCQARGIPSEGIRLLQRVEYDPVKKRLATVHLDIELPADFPEKYREAVRRAADYCAVKKTILDPPSFEIETRLRQEQRVAV